MLAFQGKRGYINLRRLKALIPAKTIRLKKGKK